MMMMRMRMTSVHFGTLMLFVCSGVEGGGGVGGCQEPVCPSGDGRCGTADGGWPMVTISGKIASAESSCQAPLADEEVRLYTAGCPGSSAKELNVEEPAAAGWKTGKDGAFEVAVPFPPGTSLLRTELCLTPRRACQPLTLNIPAQKSPPSYPGGTSSISAAGGLGGEGSGDGNRTVRVNLCLGEKRRRRRLAGWGDRDMSWLRKKKSAEEEKEKEEEKKKKRQDPGGKKRGWSNGIPWLKRHRPPLASIRRKPSSSQEDEKRLWEGADDEVGWIKRHPADEDDDDDAERARPGEKQLPAGDDLRPGKNLTPGENLSPGENPPPNDEDYADDDDDGAPNDGRPGRRRSAPGAKETARPSRLPAGHWPPRPEEMKKYWAQSDMSWL